MKGYSLGLFFSILLVSICARAQIESPEIELGQLLLDLEVYDSMLRVGVDTQGIRKAEMAYADRAFDLLEKNSPVYFQRSLIKRWFNLEISKNSRFSKIAQEVVGLNSLAYSNEQDSLQAMRNSGLIQFLGEILPEEEKNKLKGWISQHYGKWIEGIQAQLVSEDPATRLSGLKYLIQNRSNSEFLNGFTKNVIEPLGMEQKVRLVDDLIHRPEATLKTFYMVYAIRSIPLETWVEGHTNTLVEIFRLGHMLDIFAQNIIVALVNRPNLARARISLAPIMVGKKTTSDGELPSVFNGKSLMIAEQLMLMSESYRSAIFRSLVVSSNLWSLDLIQFSFDNGLTPTTELARTLSKAPATQDPRWFQWILQLEKNQRISIAGDLAKLGRLYRSTSDLAFEVQKEVFEAALRTAQHGFIDPLEDFINNSLRNPRLVAWMGKKWGADILAEGNLALNRAFVEKIYFHKDVDLTTRMFWLEILLIRIVTIDSSILKLLIKGHGLGIDYRGEMERAEGNLELQEEIMRASLTETYFSESERPGIITCKKVFSF